MGQFDHIFSEKEMGGKNQTIDSPQVIRMRQKRRAISRMRLNNLTRYLDELPEKDEAIHIVSDGQYDYFNMVEAVLELKGQPCKNLTLSTWSINRENTDILFELFDNKLINGINIIMGNYFKERYQDVYAHLYEGLQKRGQKYATRENHTKIMLFHFDDDYIVIEGSANLTNNRRMKQNVIMSSKMMYEFHKNWMDDILQSE